MDEFIKTSEKLGEVDGKTEHDVCRRQETRSGREEAHAPTATRISGWRKGAV